MSSADKQSRKTPTYNHLLSQDTQSSNKCQKNASDSNTDVNMSESNFVTPSPEPVITVPLEGLNASMHSTQMNKDESFNEKLQSSHVEKGKQSDLPNDNEKGNNFNPESTNKVINISTLFNEESALVTQNEHLLFALAENVKGNTMNEKYTNIFKD